MSATTGPTAQITDPLQRLYANLAITTRCRFNASKRLEKRDTSIGWIIAMASAYTIIVSVIPYFFKLPIYVVDSLTLAVVGFSIVTLVSSLLMASRKDAVNAEQHHRSALELNEVRRGLESDLYDAQVTGVAIAKNATEEWQKKYSDILQKYSVNHDDIDFKRQQYERPHEYKWLTWWQKRKIWISLFIYDNFALAVLLGGTIFFVWLVFRYALPKCSG